MDNVKTKPHSVLQQGPIPPDFVSASIASHSAKTGLGAHTIFLGQVRRDEIEGKPVEAIEYSAYPEMAEKEFYKIREEAFAKYELGCLHIHHSLGLVKAGEISLFVFVSAKHRKQVFEACSYLVEQIKVRIPIWGKEITGDGSYTWKENKPA
jgi:molybdopterin synthase catalytic subunit